MPSGDGGGAQLVSTGVQVTRLSLEPWASRVLALTGPVSWANQCDQPTRAAPNPKQLHYVA